MVCLQQNRHSVDFWDRCIDANIYEQFLFFLFHLSTPSPLLYIHLLAHFPLHSLLLVSSSISPIPYTSLQIHTHQHPSTHKSSFTILVLALVDGTGVIILSFYCPRAPISKKTPYRTCGRTGGYIPRAAISGDGRILAVFPDIYLTIETRHGIEAARFHRYIEDKTRGGKRVSGSYTSIYACSLTAKISQHITVRR
jgi:hypothetical protein